MESGIYITFLSSERPAERELPPVGPLDNVVLRQKRLVAERRSVYQAEELGVAIDRWLEAELELQRATGQETGDTKRSDRRFTARDGLFVRFVVFGDAQERDRVGELGPFAAVVVRACSVEADGATLATRAASDLAPWELITGDPDAITAIRKPDIAFRTPTSAYHPGIAPLAARARVEPPRPEPAFTLPPRGEPVFTPPPPREEEKIPDLPRISPESFSPQPLSVPQAAVVPEAAGVRETMVVPESDEAEPLTPGDLELIERLDRERRDETPHATRYRPPRAPHKAVAHDLVGAREWGAALWQTRFAIIGVLLLGVAMYLFVMLRTGSAPTIGQGQQVQSVGIAQKFSSARWDLVVNAAQTAAAAGTARARGIFYVVRIAATNRGAEGQQLSPSDFTLIDANGIEHGPEGLAGGTYEGPDNATSPYSWPDAFPLGKTVSLSVVFDVDPTLPRGMLLKVSDPPNIRVRLD